MLWRGLLALPLLQRKKTHGKNIGVYKAEEITRASDIQCDTCIYPRLQKKNQCSNPPLPETVADLDLNYRPLPLGLSSVTDLPKKKVRAKQLHVTIKYLGNVIVPRPAIFGLSRWGFLWFVSRSPGPAAPVTGSSLLLSVSRTPSRSFSREVQGFYLSTLEDIISLTRFVLICRITKPLNHLTIHFHFFHNFSKTNTFSCFP